MTPEFDVQGSESEGQPPRRVKPRRTGKLDPMLVGAGLLTAVVMGFCSVGLMRDDPENDAWVESQTTPLAADEGPSELMPSVLGKRGPAVAALEDPSAPVALEATSIEKVDRDGETAPEPPAVAMAPPSAAAAAEPEAGTHVQLFAMSSERAARQAWTELSTEHGDLLAGLAPHVIQADLGERGVIYRLQAGPVEDREAAERLCGALSARSVGCLVP
jgi:cell division septation protein DedD